MTSPQFRLRVSPRRDARAVKLSFVPAVAHHEFRRFGLLRGLPQRSPACARVDPSLILPAGGPVKGRPEDISSTAVPDGDRRQITVLFCDLVGSTEICAQLDPEEYQSVLLHYEGICAEALQRFHGYLYQKQGDGIIAYFGYPTAAEDAAERAIRAGLMIIDALSQRPVSDVGFLKARVGVSTGLVVISDPRSGNVSAVGNAMNLAARLQSSAAAGEVLVANATKLLAGAYFEYVDRGAQRLKGLPQPVHAWSVLRTSSNDDRFEARLGRSITPFVGRDKELDLLLQHWRSSENGSGVTVVLSGEPGIGKSRLVLALREVIPTGPMLRLQSSPIFSNSAYYPFVSLLRDELARRGSAQSLTQAELLSAIFHDGGANAAMELASLSALLSLVDGPAPLATSSSFEQRNNAINGFIRSIAWLIEDQPALLIFEDAHWADPTTLEVLDRLVATLRSRKVLAIVTCRLDLKRKWPPGCKFLRLRRLSHRSARRLATTVASGRLTSDVLRDISAKAGGIPLFLEEVTKLAIEQPESPSPKAGKDGRISGIAEGFPRGSAGSAGRGTPDRSGGVRVRTRLCPGRAVGGFRLHQGSCRDRSAPAVGRGPHLPPLFNCRSALRLQARPHSGRCVRFLTKDRSPVASPANCGAPRASAVRIRRHSFRGASASLYGGETSVEGCAVLAQGRQA